MDTDNSKPDHLWKRGVSGNPKGKPRGTKSKSTQLVERLVTGNPADVKAIIDVTVREVPPSERKSLWGLMNSRPVRAGP